MIEIEYVVSLYCNSNNMIASRTTCADEFAAKEEIYLYLKKYPLRDGYKIKVFKRVVELTLYESHLAFLKEFEKQRQQSMGNE